MDLQCLQMIFPQLEQTVTPIYLPQISHRFFDISIALISLSWMYVKILEQVYANDVPHEYKRSTN